MISRLKGIVEHKDEKAMVIQTGGVGYKVFANYELLKKTKEGENISLWTHLAVRENALDLYGFQEKEELDFFEMLISISGIGPKTALGILNAATIPAIKKAVSSKDTAPLVKVSGIGKKIAEKIILELKDKIDKETGDEISLKDEVDALEGLKSLGYSQHEAREALKQVDKNITNAGARVKQALKILGRNH